MTIAVRFLSKTGNTEKLAETVAKAVGVSKEDISVPVGSQVDLLFLGTAVYAAGIDKQIEDFLQMNRDRIGMVASFSTAALMPGSYRQMRKVCDRLGIRLLESEFHCMGKFGPMHSGRPNRRDRAQAAEWAGMVVESMLQ